MPGEVSESTQWNHANPVLEVSDVPRAITYYRDVFGLAPSWIWEDRIGGIHTDHSSIEIYLSRAERPSPSRLVIFVDDADAAHHKYRTSGAEIVDRLKTQPWGLRGFTVPDPDPDGNLIDIAHEVHSPTERAEYKDLTAPRRPNHTSHRPTEPQLDRASESLRSARRVEGVRLSV